MLILTDNISHETLMLADFQSDTELESWIKDRFDLSDLGITQAVKAVKARDNNLLANYGLRIRQITDLRHRYIPDINSLVVDLGACGITVSEESSLADVVSTIYHVDPERAEKYL
nr:MAG TPA: hypothetical protein [Caudoviricetes sp.]